MGGIDHRLDRSGQRLQRRQRQPSVTCRIAFEVTPVSLGDGCADLIHHAGGRCQLSRHYRLRPLDLLRLRLDGFR